MFGLVAAGQLVQGAPTQVDETHFLFEVPNVDAVNHLVVFLTGAVAFPPGIGGAVHFRWPGDEGWSFLGHLSNEKPSAIFKLARRKGDAGPAASAAAPGWAAQGGAQVCTVAQVGISVEALGDIAELTPPAGTQAVTVPAMVQFTERMLGSLFEHAMSFAVSRDAAALAHSRSNQEFIPLSALKSWRSKIEREMQNNPTFWKR